MAKVTVNSFTPMGRVKRKGVHAKSKSSKIKNSKNYVKLYKGQGN